jgi:hypothetical protein
MLQVDPPKHEIPADRGQLEMIRAQVGALKGAPADQVVRVSYL